MSIDGITLIGQRVARIMSKSPEAHLDAFEMSTTEIDESMGDLVAS